MMELKEKLALLALWQVAEESHFSLAEALVQLMKKNIPYQVAICHEEPGNKLHTLGIVDLTTVCGLGVCEKRIAVPKVFLITLSGASGRTASALRTACINLITYDAIQSDTYTALHL